MKAILMSIRPRHVANILNGIKTLEIRKKFPSDYVGWVYVYCTKENELVYFGYGGRYAISLDTKEKISQFDNWELGNLNDVQWFGDGKVIARFWCDKVEEIKYHFGYYDMGEWTESYILENSCLSAKELDNYLQASKEYDETKVSKVYGYAIHITKLETFDTPKELWEFKTPMMAERYKYDLEKAYEDDYEIGTRLAEGIADPKYECANCVELTELSEGYYGLSQAPRNGWCYVAELEN